MAGGGVVGAGVSEEDITSIGLWFVEKKSSRSTSAQPRLADAFPMKSRQIQPQRDTQYHQRMGQIIIVCVNYSIPLSNTLSLKPHPIFTGHKRSNTLSRTTTQAKNQWETHKEIQHFL